MKKKSPFLIESKWALELMEVIEENLEKKNFPRELLIDFIQRDRRFIDIIADQITKSIIHLEPKRIPYSLNLFPHDLSSTLEELLYSCGLHRSRDLISLSVLNEKNFKKNNYPSSKLEIELFRFKINYSNEYLLSKIEKEGYRPVDLYELLFLIKNHRSIMKEFQYIVSLGSIFKDPTHKMKDQCCFIEESGFIDFMIMNHDYYWENVCYPAIRKL